LGALGREVLEFLDEEVKIVVVLFMAIASSSRDFGCAVIEEQEPPLVGGQVD
jgi:hypothetical protein